MRTPLVLAALVIAAAPVTACSDGSDPVASPAPPTTGAATAPADPGRPVTFPAADGAELTGMLFGAGSTAVVLSNMGDNDPADWQRFAPVLGRQGYLVLTYQFRYPVRTQSFTATMATETLADLRGAIAFVRERGAADVVLVGASLGGMATASLAGADGVRAAVVLSSPAEIPELGYAVDTAALEAGTVPILYIAGDRDPVVPAADTRRLYDLTAGPREWQSYPEAGHGSELLDTASGPALTQRLIRFLAETVPAG
ncbi:MAG: dienelactone hydrolase family protein [Sporichthyaceae bacterium]|nr:dienelactone hydrolase family protein [Sporichthyaceae bacterium]